MNPDPWDRLRALTPARIALGRAGAGLPTREVLALALAHARARDAVHAAFDVAALARAVDALGLTSFAVASAAPTRDVYLRRPDLGRRLSADSRDAALRHAQAGCDVAVVLADGLSPVAVAAHAPALLQALVPKLVQAKLTAAPIAIAIHARVALGDEIGAALGARVVVVLIGERPGLSAADSLGAYLTHAPRVGRSDAERNCVSNVHGGGLSYAQAAAKIAWLVRESLRRGVSGIALKDESERLFLERAPGSTRG